MKTVETEVETREVTCGRIGNQSVEACIPTKSDRSHPQRPQDFHNTTTAFDHLRIAAQTAITAGMSLKEFRALAVAVLVDEAIQESQNNQVRAARLIGTHRNTLWRLRRFRSGEIEGRQYDD